MAKMKKFFSIMILLALLVGVIGNPSGQASTATGAHPILVQLAADDPQQQVSVIVQKTASDGRVEALVTALGGRVTKDLHIIHGFAAEVPAAAVLKLAASPLVRWVSPDAPVENNGVPPQSVIIRDQFPTNSYTGNSGTHPWNNKWYESGESDGAGSGALRVTTGKCASSYCLRLGNFSSGTRYVYRSADTTQASNAILSFSYRRDYKSSVSTVGVDVSADAGQTWNNLATYTVNGSDASHIQQSFDISAYRSVDTRVRFTVSKSSSYIWIDNVQISGESTWENIHRSSLTADFVNDYGITGQGVTVAVVDSGMYMHPEYADRVIAQVNVNSYSQDTLDNYGHGTHIAGTIAGSGALYNGSYKGIAPGANLINVKVGDQVGIAWTSDLIAGVQWIFDNRLQYNIRVVNLSMNSTLPESYHTSPLDAALEILWFNGIVVVVSAGNFGQLALFPPANDPFLIAVGSVDDLGTFSYQDDTLTVFSSFGTTQEGFSKPDLVAPGMDIVSGLAPNSTLPSLYQDHTVAGRPEYFRMSGTSMSAAVVSGVVALVLQNNPNLNPDQVKYRLMATAQPFYGGNNAGYVDAYGAVFGTTTETANTGIAASQLLWTGSEPITWGSVNWGSVNWGSVNWGSVNWGSVNWGSVNWGSDYWGLSGTELKIDALMSGNYAILP